MTRVLITGATGNVGMEVIKSLSKFNHSLEVYAGVRDVESEKHKSNLFKYKSIKFDFTDIDTYKPALENCDILFLLRPPQISDVKKYFEPLIELAIQSNTKHIVFLSVQGVEKSKMIPHHKIEKLIVESKIPYTFLRPAYFMQNFSTILYTDLAIKKKIFLPAGNAKFTLVDISDIGEVTAKVLADVQKHINQSYELTCNEKLTFNEMALKLSKGLNTTIKYESPSILKFYFTKRKEKIPSMFILVMIMLHYLPRFQKEPDITDCIKRILNKEPNNFDQFIKNCLKFIQ
ncbi:MAG: NmrA family NAD(P)-binding protein [Bacteroidetes bacterium]|nr:NmrA family NAD(P)-binding protein [Bacteroidota bacterium]